MIRFAVLLALLAPAAAAAAPCPPEALGTTRVMQVDALHSPRVGRKQFPQTLPLAPKEVVLTFDDGPWPGTTPKVLESLAHECVRATFFMLGRNALAHPQIARRVFAEGHTVAHHTFSHRLLNSVPMAAAQEEIEHGVEAVESAVYGRPQSRPITPFFRFPGFASTPALLDDLQRRGIVVFGADLWASDWNAMTPAQEFDLLVHRLEAAGGGIILLHDTRAQTAAMLPAFLRELRTRGYSVVHVVPAPAMLR